MQVHLPPARLFPACLFPCLAFYPASTCTSMFFLYLATLAQLLVLLTRAWPACLYSPSASLLGFHLCLAVSTCVRASVLVLGRLYLCLGIGTCNWQLVFVLRRCYTASTSTHLVRVYLLVIYVFPKYKTYSPYSVDLQKMIAPE